MQYILVYVYLGYARMVICHTPMYAQHTEILSKRNLSFEHVNVFFHHLKKWGNNSTVINVNLNEHLRELPDPQTRI